MNFVDLWLEPFTWLFRVLCRAPNGQISRYFIGTSHGQLSGYFACVSHDGYYR